MKNTEQIQRLTKYSKSEAIALMSLLGIKKAEIANDAKTDRQLVARALDINKSKTVGHGAVLKVRGCVVRRLRNAGWDGNPEDLWREYDDDASSEAAA